MLHSLALQFQFQVPQELGFALIAEIYEQLLEPGSGIC